MKKVFLVLAALITSSGCATTISMAGWEPGNVSVGKANRIVITDAEGRRSARETVAIELKSAAGQGGYFQVEDRSADGVKLEVAGRNVTPQNDPKGITDSDIYVRADVLEWTANKDTHDVTDTDSKGNKTTRTVKVLKAKVLLAATVANLKGNALLAEKEYEGVFETEEDMGDDKAIEEASKLAVAHLLADITPKRVTYNVRVDDSDEGQKAIIETAKKGNIGQAVTDIKVYIQANPNSPAAHYNLGVFLDAMGAFDEALDMYDKGMSLGGKDFYAEARAACAKRKQAAEELKS